MHGNVFEWCLSLYKPYPYRADDGRDSPTASGSRAVRGGSWDDLPRRCRSAFRLNYPPDYRVYNVGFRILCPAR
jgi:formylglycine-generating enzyme required for sulfatase activity